MHHILPICPFFWVNLSGRNPVLNFNCCEGAGTLSQQIAVAERGLSKSQYELGRIYSEGKHAKRNMAEAIKWLNESAERGHVDGRHALMNIYEKRGGVMIDAEKSMCYKNLEHWRRFPDGMDWMSIIPSRRRDKKHH